MVQAADGPLFQALFNRLVEPQSIGFDLKQPFGRRFYVHACFRHHSFEERC